jgi:hypothetical protein
MPQPETPGTGANMDRPGWDACLHAQPGDEMVDLFPGTNAVGAAWSEWAGEQGPLPCLPLEMHA